MKYSFTIKLKYIYMLVETSRFLEYTVQNCKIITVMIPEINGKNSNSTLVKLSPKLRVDIK